MCSTTYARCSPQHPPTIYHVTYIVGVCGGQLYVVPGSRGHDPDPPVGFSLDQETSPMHLVELNQNNGEKVNWFILNLKIQI